MKQLLQQLNIEFDSEGNTLLSKEKLLKLLEMVRSDKLIKEDDALPDEFYLLVDRNRIDFYSFPLVEYPVWEQDGSFEPGDAIYKTQLIKRR
jgi:hypothetical protein